MWGLSFNKNGDKFVSCSDDRTLRVWCRDENKVFLDDILETEICFNFTTLNHVIEHDLYLDRYMRLSKYVTLKLNWQCFLLCSIQYQECYDIHCMFTALFSNYLYTGY